MSNELERVADFRAIIREFTEYAKPTGNPDSDMTPDDWEVGLATFLARASRPAPQVVTTMDELEALPVMSVFTDVDGEAWQVYEDRHGRRIRCNAGSGISWQEAYFPATVLYPHPTPDVDVLAEVRAAMSTFRTEMEEHHYQYAGSGGGPAFDVSSEAVEIAQAHGIRMNAILDGEPTQ